ncbi:uncharacterized protein [Linepithema humile]|uniref:uncharacterized protein n=1 Tax=Linepithema humile TaxID=83485 RepID=UPI00351E27FD
MYQCLCTNGSEMLHFCFFDLFYQTLFETALRSVTRNMSRAIDVVNEPELPDVWNWVQENYILSNSQATCKECQQILYFVSTETIQAHIERNHETTYQFEETHKDKRWKNFRKIDDSNYVKCVVCEKSFSFGNAFDHQHRADDRQIVTDIDYYWVFKYFRLTVSAYVHSANCILCEYKEFIAFEETIFLHFKRAHSDKWGERLPFIKELAVLKGAVNLSRLELFLKICERGHWGMNDWKGRTTAINWVKRKYQLKPRFQAECKKCFDIFNSIDTASFDQHIYIKELYLFNMESQRLVTYCRNAYWINFRRLKWKQEVQCVICSKKFPMMTNDWRKHLHDNDNNYIRHYTWQCKYVKEIKDDNDDFKGRCTVCEQEHDFHFMPAIHLFLHIFDNKCRNLMRRDYLATGIDSRPTDDLPMQRQRMESFISFDGPSTSREIN